MKKLKILAALLCLLLLTACGDLAAKDPPPATEPAQTPEETQGDTNSPEEAPEEDAGSSEETPEDAGEPEETASRFAEMPGSFMFCSGAGAWSTTLEIDGNGAFKGVYLDSDMGDSSENYPAGTRYICEFSGQFTEPEVVDETTWSMKIASIELAHPNDGAEEYADGARYIYSGPYGLEEAEELRIYLPDTPADGLPEEFVHWIQGPYDWSPTEEGTLGIWGIYNVSEGLGFTVYPWA